MTEKELYEKLSDIAEILLRDRRPEFAQVLRTVGLKAQRLGDTVTLSRWLRDAGYDH